MVINLLKAPALFAGLVALSLFIGCDGEVATENGDGENGDHKHGEHDHRVGPHDGDIVELEQAGAEYTIEWTHDEKSGLLTVYILDEKGEKEVAIEASEVVIETSFEKDETIERALTPVNPTDGNPPAASRFERKDKDLLTDLELDAHAHVKFTVGDKSYSAHIEHHDH